MTSRPLTSSAEGSRAREQVTPAAVEESKTPDGSGLSLLGSFAWYDRDSCLWRTSQVSLIPDEGCPKFSAIWPRAGMTQNGIAYQRQPSVRHTSVIGSGSWLTGKATHNVPTPTASDHIERKSTSSEILNFETNKTVSLDRWVRRWPTPAARDWKGRGYSGQLPNEVNGVPNPTWVEWLLGLPMGWTDLEDSETPLSPIPPNGSDGD